MSRSTRHSDPPTTYANPHDPNDPEPWGPAESLPPIAPITAPTSERPDGRRRKSRKWIGVLAAMGIAYAGVWTAGSVLRADVTTSVLEPFAAVAVAGRTTEVVVRYDNVPHPQLVEKSRPRGARLEHRVVNDRLEVDRRNTRPGQSRRGPAPDHRI